MMKAAILEAQEHNFRPIPLELGKAPKANYIQQSVDAVSFVLEKYQEAGADHNVGIVTGKASGVTVVDLDVKEGCSGIDEFRRFCDDNAISVRTPCVRTPSGGLHYYFAYCPALKCGTNVLRSLGYRNIDVKSDGGLVVYPGSRYPGCSGKWGVPTDRHKCGAEADAECRFRGGAYAWQVRPSAEVPLQEVPAALVSALAPPRARAAPVGDPAPAAECFAGSEVILGILQALRGSRFTDRHD